MPLTEGAIERAQKEIAIARSARRNMNSACVRRVTDL